MKPLRSSNPAFSAKAFEEGIASGHARTDVETMTVSGTVNKTGILALLLAASASYVWMNPSQTLMWVGIIGGLIAALVTVFKPGIAHITAPVYALLKGMALGMISLTFETMFSGGGLSGSIVFQAVASTIGVLFAMLFLYRSGLIKVTKKFRTGLMAATGGIFIMYMFNLVMGFFGGAFLSLENTSLLMIGINLVIVAVAAMNLILDFDFIERGAEAGAPKNMEWYGAFGLIVTLVWLYLEILKLLARLQSRN